MANIKKEFNKYKIFYYTGSSGIEAIISLYSDATKVGSISFYKEGTTLPANESASYITVYSSIARFNDIVTILRYEKPLYINLIVETLAGYISTDPEEAVGEQEPA